MPTFDQLEWAVSRATQVAHSGRVRVVGRVVLAGGLIFGLLRVGSTWRSSHIALGSVDRLSLGLACGAALTAVALASIAWMRILHSLGISTRMRWGVIYLQAQLAKYLPGSVWQYAGRVALSRTEGIPVRTSALSVTIELAASVAAAALISLFLIGTWGTVLLAAIGLAAIAASTAAWRRLTGALRAFVLGVCLYVPITLLLGLSLWMISQALFHHSDAGFTLFAGSFAVAWLGGLAAVFAPGGLGIREAILVALLRHELGTSDAVVLAAGSRLVLTAVDLLAAGAATALYGMGASQHDGESRQPREAPDVVDTRAL